MNNTYNYSFLIESKYGEPDRYKYFIPSTIISQKYIKPAKPKTSAMNLKKTRLSAPKNN